MMAYIGQMLWKDLDPYPSGHHYLYAECQSDNSMINEVYVKYKLNTLLPTVSTTVEISSAKVPLI